MDRRAPAQRAVARDPRLERAALDVFEGHVGPRRPQAQVEDPHEVRVLDAPQRLRLATKALDELRLAGVEHDLERDGAAVARVLGAEHRAHAAAPELLQHAIGSDLGLHPCRLAARGGARRWTSVSSASFR